MATQKVGKQTGGDVLANKNTLLSILAEMNSSDVTIRIKA